MQNDLFGEPGHQPGHISDDPFIGLLHKVVRAAVPVLAALMVAVIVWDIGDVFLNITLYLKTGLIPVRLVVATALMVISRKVLIFDFDIITPPFVAATSALVLSFGIIYWLISRKNWPL